MKNIPALASFIELDCKVSVYVPSTKDVNIPIDNRKEVEGVLKMLSHAFGGATSTDAIGAWVSASGLVRERTTIVFAYCNSDQLKSNITYVINYCEALKSSLGQEAIALEVNNKLYFI